MPMVGIDQDGTARMPWTPKGPLNTTEIEYVAGSLRQLLDQNPKGAIRRAEVSFPVQPPDGGELELGCWLQAILPKLAPLKEVILEFVSAPTDLNAMLTTPLSAMPRTRVRVRVDGVEILE